MSTTKLFRATCVVLLGLSALACGSDPIVPESEQDDSRIIPVPLTRTDAGDDCDLTSTPGGRVPKSCVHEVPNGARVQINAGGQTVVTKDGMIIAVYPPCSCSDAGMSGK